LAFHRAHQEILSAVIFEGERFLGRGQALRENWPFTADKQLDEYGKEGVGCATRRSGIQKLRLSLSPTRHAATYKRL
jgi:hypothetical protein